MSVLACVLVFAACSRGRPLERYRVPGTLLGDLQLTQELVDPWVSDDGMELHGVTEDGFVSVDIQTALEEVIDPEPGASIALLDARTGGPGVDRLVRVGSETLELLAGEDEPTPLDIPEDALLVRYAGGDIVFLEQGEQCRLVWLGADEEEELPPDACDLADLAVDPETGDVWVAARQDVLLLSATGAQSLGLEGVEVEWSPSDRTLWTITTNGEIARSAADGALPRVVLGAGIRTDVRQLAALPGGVAFLDGESDEPIISVLDGGTLEVASQSSPIPGLRLAAADLAPVFVATGEGYTEVFLYEVPQS